MWKPAGLLCWGQLWTLLMSRVVTVQIWAGPWGPSWPSWKWRSAETYGPTVLRSAMVIAGSDGEHCAGVDWSVRSKLAVGTCEDLQVVFAKVNYGHYWCLGWSLWRRGLVHEVQADHAGCGDLQTLSAEAIYVIADIHWRVNTGREWAGLWGPSWPRWVWGPTDPLCWGQLWSLPMMMVNTIQVWAGPWGPSWPSWMWWPTDPLCWDQLWSLLMSRVVAVQVWAGPWGPGWPRWMWGCVGTCRPSLVEVSCGHYLWWWWTLCRCGLVHEVQADQTGSGNVRRPAGPLSSLPTESLRAQDRTIPLPILPRGGQSTNQIGEGAQVCLCWGQLRDSVPDGKFCLENSKAWDPIGRAKCRRDDIVG